MQASAFIDQLLHLFRVCYIHVVTLSSQRLQLCIGTLCVLGLVEQPLLKLRQLITQLHHLQTTASLCRSQRSGRAQDRH